MPGVTARAAMTPDHQRVTPEHLFDADVMIGAARGTSMRHARGFHLGWQRVRRFFGWHELVLVPPLILLYGIRTIRPGPKTGVVTKTAPVSATATPAGRIS
jgi:hypothetical protein